MSKHTEKFNIAGTSFRQDEIFSLAKENDEYEMTKKQLIDEGYEDERVYMYYFNPKKTELIPEPDNEHDPNAIKVVAQGVHIGYVKASDCAYIKELMESGRVSSYGVDLEGGPYKIVTEDEDGEYQLEKDEDDYFGKLLITVVDDEEDAAPTPSAAVPEKKPGKLLPTLFIVFGIISLLLSILFPVMLLNVAICVIGYLKCRTPKAK